MRRIARACLAVALGLALAAPAGGQPRPGPTGPGPTAAGLEDPEAHIVSELVVVAKERGPAWWRVTDGDTTVYILGVPGGPLPPGVAWDRRVLQARLAGASTVIMGTQVRAGLRDLPALLRIRSRMRSKTPMEAGLAAPLRARFVAAREQLGKPAGRYEKWQPVVAGQMLAFDAQHGWSSVEEQVKGMARTAHARVRTSASYDLVPLVNRMLDGLTPEIQTRCLEGALSDVEAGAGPFRRAADGWARGDTAVALTQPRGFEPCLLALSGGAQLWRDATRDNVEAIAQALKTPGHAVAVVSLRTLLADGGVVEQLEARGLRVIGPGEG